MEINIDTDFAWAAGIVDGEGTIQLKSIANNKYYTMCVQVSMTHKETVEEFLRIMMVGKIYFKKARKTHWKDEYMFLAHGQDAVICVKKIIPYLRTKKTQAELILEYNEKCTQKKYGHGVPIPEEVQYYRKLISSELHDINRRGKKG